jgi:acetyl esterase/lipase
MENHGVWLEPIDADLIMGDVKTWAVAASVTPARIPGYWLGRSGENTDLPSGAPPAPGEKVIYALHGGAYVVLSAAPGDPTGNIAIGLLEHIPSVRRVFSAEYRLSAGEPAPRNPFPAALLDALAGYAYLVRVVGFSPADILVEGDSAGGNLALALVRYLVEHRDALAQAGLAPPGGVILLSPWCDLGTSHDAPHAPYLAQSDLIAGPHGFPAADTNLYISPASKHLASPPSFAGWPRTLVVCGGAESFAASIRTLKERMSADMGEGPGAGRLVYYEAPDGVHDYVMLPWHEPERTATLRAVAEWVAAA